MSSSKRSVGIVTLTMLLVVGGCSILDISRMFAEKADEFAVRQYNCDPQTAVPWLRCDTDFRLPSLPLEAIKPIAQLVGKLIRGL